MSRSKKHKARPANSRITHSGRINLFKGYKSPLILNCDILKYLNVVHIPAKQRKQRTRQMARHLMIILHRNQSQIQPGTSPQCTLELVRPDFAHLRVRDTRRQGPDVQGRRVSQHVSRSDYQWTQNSRESPHTAPMGKPQAGYSLHQQPP